MNNVASSDIRADFGEDAHASTVVIDKISQVSSYTLMPACHRVISVPGKLLGKSFPIRV